MFEQSDFEYYSGRAAVERELGRTAKDPTIAEIHASLARDYEALAERFKDEPGTEPRVVSG